MAQCALKYLSEGRSHVKCSSVKKKKTIKTMGGKS